MSGSAGDGLLVAVDSRIHRLPAQVKLVALFVFVLAVVSTPADSAPSRTRRVSSTGSARTPVIRR